jgi:N-succinyldiaminopimelate aminotransferase
MNPNLDKLQAYPFERFRQLIGGESIKDLPAVSMSIGEPGHQPPPAVLAAMTDALATVAKYPPTRGDQRLRATIANWLSRRFNLGDDTLDCDRHVLPVNGTREALFAIAQCLFDAQDHTRDLVLIPNPFYQIYEGAALLAGATPYFYNTNADNQYQPDFDAIPASVWARCQMIYLCTPGNPSGSVVEAKQMQQLLALSQTYGFTIISDECYSEIYPAADLPPSGLLQEAVAAGNQGFDRCVVFNSLSKRSNLPGLRSGLVAGDATIIESFLKFRTYHGCAMPGYVSAASMVAWNDEQHVIDNRALYQAKFDRVLPVLESVLPVVRPDAGFFLWVDVNQSDTEFARQLYREKSVSVLPGSYLSRQTEHGNPGDNHVRLALVAPLDNCVEATHRIRDFIAGTNT